MTELYLFNYNIVDNFNSYGYNRKTCVRYNVNTAHLQDAATFVGIQLWLFIYRFYYRIKDGAGFMQLSLN